MFLVYEQMKSSLFFSCVNYHVCSSMEKLMIYFSSQNQMQNLALTV